MAGGDRPSFKAFVERLSLPYVLIVGLATALANLNRAIAETGFRVLSLSAFVMAVLWTYHVLTARKPSDLAPNHSRPVHGQVVRITASAVMLLSLLPIWLAFRPAPVFQLPRMSFIVWNETAADLNLQPFGEFYIAASDSPVIEIQLTSGKIRIGSGREPVYVPSGKSLLLDADFVAPDLYEGFYRRGDLDVRFVLRTTDDRLVPSSFIAFRHEWLAGEPIAFSAR